MIQPTIDKKCAECGIPKPPLSFTIKKRGSDVRRITCKDCERKYAKAYRQKNIERIREKAKKYRKENPHILRRQHERSMLGRKKEGSVYQKWCLYNIEKVREYKRRSERKRRYEISFILKKRMKKRMKRALASQNVHQTNATLKMLGCTAKEFKAHLESQFVDGMSWANYGYSGWHIDHIMPISSFNLNDVEEQKVCFNYRNTRPLWGKENLSKGKKIILR